MWCFGRRTTTERYLEDGVGVCGTSGREASGSAVNDNGRARSPKGAVALKGRRAKESTSRAPNGQAGQGRGGSENGAQSEDAGDAQARGRGSEVMDRNQMKELERKDRLAAIMASNLCEVDPVLKRKIGEKRLSVLRRQFSWHDADNNGYIESNELPDFLRSAGFNPVQPSLELWCSHLDSRNEGCLTFPDYVTFWYQNNSELEHDEALIQMAFTFFDRDGDGNVDKNEFVECLQELGDPLTQGEIDRFFHHVRTTGTGTETEVRERGLCVRVEDLIMIGKSV